MEEFKKGIDVYGWVGCVMIVGAVWLVCLWDALHDYYVIHQMELVKLVFAMMSTVVIWLLHLLYGSRDWLESQKAAMEWAWDKAIEVVREVDKVGVKSFKEIHNIGIESTAGKGVAFTEVIGEE